MCIEVIVGNVSVVFLRHSIFGKVGRVASEEVVIELITSKCIPALLYGLEACPLTKSNLQSLDFVINRFFYEIISN